MASINRARVAADWTKRSFGCDFWIDKPGQRLPGGDLPERVAAGGSEPRVTGYSCERGAGVDRVPPGTQPLLLITDRSDRSYRSRRPAS
jgi:hypothetical protein